MLERHYSYSDINQLPDPSDQRVKLRKKRSIRKIPKFFVIFLFLLFVALSYQVFSTSESIFFNDDQSVGIIEKLKGLLTADSKKLKGESDDRVNILILGMGGPGHDGPYLTDSILLASYRPSDDQLALLSIPRDLAVYIPKYGFRKINSVNAVGETQNPGSGGEFSRVVTSELLGVDIPYYVRVDFSAFRQLVDDLDGLEINVERGFTDYQYPAANYKYQVISFKEGLQRMDGDTALKYVRSRHGCCGEGGDFARAKRQQIFLSALKEKILQEKSYLDPKQLIKIYNNYQENVNSNFKVWELVRFSKKLKKMENKGIIQVVLTNELGGELENVIGADGAYMLQPIGGNYNTLKLVARNLFRNDAEPVQNPSPTGADENDNTQLEQFANEQANIVVLNGTYISGLAGNTKEKLLNKGFNVVTIGNAPVRDYTENYVFDVSGGKNPQTLGALLEELSAVRALETPDWLETMLSSPDADILDEQTDIVVVLGTNE